MATAIFGNALLPELFVVGLKLFGTVRAVDSDLNFKVFVQSKNDIQTQIPRICRQPCWNPESNLDTFISLETPGCHVHKVSTGDNARDSILSSPSISWLALLA